MSAVASDGAPNCASRRGVGDRAHHLRASADSQLQYRTEDRLSLAPGKEG